MGLTIGPATSHSSYPANAAVGSENNGGFLMCKTGGGVAWIVSPYSTQVIRSWDFRNDAVTLAQAATGCTDWFVPSASQLQNPGYVCRNFWGSPNPQFPPAGESVVFWTCQSGTVVAMDSGSSFGQPNSQGFNVRAFRCFTY